MKKVIGIAVILLLTCTVMASATTTNWTLGILGAAANSGGGAAFIGDKWNVIGAWSTYTDGLNSAMGFGNLKPGKEGSVPPASNGRWIAVRQQGTTPVGTTDMRVKFSETVPQVKTWTMKVYYYTVGNEDTPGAVTVTIKPDVDSAGVAIAGTDGDIPSVTSGPPVLKYRYRTQLNSDAWGAWKSAGDIPSGGFAVEIITPHDTGLADILRVQVETIPEPGSLLALGSGLVGLVGFTIRRRKR